ncbi:MAG: DUF1015 domain-containing protein [candidate division NC10 bacterium]|nr:DUF1015 domain-containing protein [candidate division NC10 bacterium]
MAHIVPFRALRYNPKFVPDPAAVVTPPYDIISPEAQARYHARHPYNFIRLILAREDPPDATGQDRYDRSARAYAEWRGRGILRPDPAPAIYLYEQEFGLAEGPHRRRGFLGCVRLEDYDRKVVFPHERTFSHHKDDRLRLMRACPANLEAILGFYGGPAAPVTGLLDRYLEFPPAVQLTDDDGVTHRLWLMADPADIGRLQAALASQPVFIADGHHRYETALTYRDERRRHLLPPGDPSAPQEFVLANLVHEEDPGLIILPTHRIFRKRPRLEGPALPERLARHFRLAEVPMGPAGPARALDAALTDLAREAPDHVTCILAVRGGPCLRLTLQDERVVQELLAAGHPAAYARLPVAVLHHLLVGEILGLEHPTAGDDAIRYTRDPHEALAAVAGGGAEAALLLPPPRVANVRAVALAGGRMPQKSTYFYPKVLSGLVINPLE